MSSFKPFEPRKISLDTTNKPSVCDLTPKSAAPVSKLPPLQSTPVPRQVPNLKVPPTVKVSPNIVGPTILLERKSPKGALNQQLQAKLKRSPLLPNSKSRTESLNDVPDKVKQSPLSNPEDSPKDVSKENDTPLIPMNILEPSKAQSLLHSSPSSKNAFYTLTTPHLKQLTSGHNITQHYTTQNQLLLQQQQQYDQYQQYQQQYSTLPHSTNMGSKHMQKLLPRALFPEQYQQQPSQQMINQPSHGQSLGKSKSFCSKTAKPSSNKKHFQIPLQKCHSFKFQTAESYFQPIKNIHEEHYMKNGYVSDLGPNYPESKVSQSQSGSQATTNNNRKKKNKHPRQNKHLQGTANSQQPDSNESVQLQHPKAVLPTKKPNGVVYADLDMSPSKHGKSDSGDRQQAVDVTTALNGADPQNTTLQKHKPKTEYATLKFNDVGQEIDV